MDAGSRYGISLRVFNLRYQTLGEEIARRKGKLVYLEGENVRLRADIYASKKEN